MKIFDCFQYFDEDMILDLRLNILDKHVDQFIIVENLFMHSGKKKKETPPKVHLVVFWGVFCVRFAYN